MDKFEELKRVLIQRAIVEIQHSLYDIIHWAKALRSDPENTELANDVILHCQILLNLLKSKN